MSTAGEDEIEFYINEYKLDPFNADYLWGCENISWDYSNRVWEREDDLRDFSYRVWECEDDSRYLSDSVCNLAGNEDWERSFLHNDNSKGFFDLVCADRNTIMEIFRGTTSLSTNNVMDKAECNRCFQDSISSVVTKRLTYFDKTKYTVEATVAQERFESLYKGVIGTKASNPYLDLKWRELCRLYAMTHHVRTPFDIHEIRNYTPETFYEFLETRHKNKPLCLHWQWPLDKFSTRKNELYAYMRVVEFSMRNR